MKNRNPGFRARRAGQRGSALLIVFVFAAMVAIMLYMEMPVVAFEAQRQKEQLLIDRGNEYAHAVKLFVRRFRMYPASIDALENTNRIRFLRHRFKNPFTGKDEWRLLHAGPGGMLIDSKVNPIGNNLNGAPNNSGTTGTSGSFSASSSSGFGTSASNPTAEVVAPPLPQRPPAISVNGSGAGAGTPLETSQNPLAPLLPGGADQNVAPGAAGTQAGQAGIQPGVGLAPIPEQGVAQPGIGQPGANGAVDTSNSMQAVRNQLANSNAVQAGAGAGSNMGIIDGGAMLAGVASKVGGRSIKTVNDQSDYSLWEFYYDPTKDTLRGVAGARPGAQQAPPGGIGGNTVGTTNPGVTPGASGTSPGTDAATPVQNQQ